MRGAYGALGLVIVVLVAWVLVSAASQGPDLPDPVVLDCTDVLC